MKEFSRIFVTVGTTRFDDLVDALANECVLEELKKLGCHQLTIQLGHGKEFPDASIAVAKSRYGITCECYRLKSSIADDIRTADLVISHAGAGSCIEVLNAKKPLVVVVNESLMDNHQIELAEQLHKDGYLLYCTPQTLSNTLSSGQHDLRTLKDYQRGNLRQFIKKLDDLMGF